MSIVVTPIPRLLDLVAPAYTLGTANAAGSAATAVASNSTLLAFDGVAPAAVATSAVVGSATVAPRRDHQHADLPLQVNVQIETRSAAAASGDVSYTGSGFTPKGVLVFSMNTEDDNSVMMGAIDDDVDESSIKLFGIGGTQVAGTEATICMQFYDGGSDGQQAAASSLDVDGCTLTWTKSSSGAAGSFMLVYLG